MGVFGISYKKNWHLLNYLSFVGTYTLLFGTLVTWEYEKSHFWEVMPFLIAFFALYSTMTFLFNLVNRRKSTLLEVLGLLVNAGVFFGASYRLVDEAYGQRWVAAVSLGLAAFYAAHVYYFLVRRLLDRELLLSFTAMSAFFLAVTIPLVLSGQWITASWAIQALVMLWIAGKLDSEFLRQVSYLLYAIVLLRFGFFDLRTQYFSAAAEVPVADYLWQMVQRLVSLGIPVASLAGAGWLLQKTPPKAAACRGPRERRCALDRAAMGHRGHRRRSGRHDLPDAAPGTESLAVVLLFAAADADALDGMDRHVHLPAPDVSRPAKRRCVGAL